jgi:hypothetical protein
LIVKINISSKLSWTPKSITASYSTILSGLVMISQIGSLLNCILRVR